MFRNKIKKVSEKDQVPPPPPADSLKTNDQAFTKPGSGYPGVAANRMRMTHAQIKKASEKDQVRYLSLNPNIKLDDLEFANNTYASNKNQKKTSNSTNQTKRSSSSKNQHKKRSSSTKQKKLSLAKQVPPPPPADSLKTNNQPFTKPIFPAFAPSRVNIMSQGNQDSPTTGFFESTHLYVTNLPANTNMAEISKMFPECIGIELGVNNPSEPHAAFVEFLTVESAERSSLSARGASLRGNTLIISPKIKYN